MAVAFPLQNAWKILEEREANCFMVYKNTRESSKIHCFCGHHCFIGFLYLHRDLAAVLKSDRHFAFRVDSHRIDGGKPEFFIKLSKQLIVAFHISKKACYLFPLGGALQHFIVDFSNAILRGFVAFHGSCKQPAFWPLL
ncbi:hypothetical protein EDD76_1034 [Kineothrix alysoides]|uniref:Uncharacterized protein n=1 Tax=Kineothrix alysoides TaxID=1469948 RepID=A0A4R1R380_9FIRM|nr:hypothetical protein EDD76_1034 [Kineothrix alysoides]